MSDEIKSLLENQGRAFDEFKATNDARLKAIEAGKGTADFDAKLAKINEDLDAQKSAMDELAKKAGRPAAGDNKDPAKAEHKAAFDKFVRKGQENGLRELEAKAMSVGTAADGGYTVPEEIDNAIQDLLVNVSAVRPLANVVSVSTSDYKKLVNVHGTASGWVGETAARPATNTSQFAEVPALMGELYANPQVTQQLLDDSIFNIENWVASEVGLEFARAENAAFVVGTGTSQPKGILAYTTAATADGSRTFGVLEHVATGVAGDWAASNPADTLLTLIYKLKAGHRAGASFMTNKALLAEIRKFKDTTGNYIWQPGLAAGQPSSILGYAVHEAEDVPVKAASSLSLAFGNFKAGYTIVDRVGTRMLRDPYSNKPYVGFYTTKRVGGMVTDSEAIKVLKFAVA